MRARSLFVLAVFLGLVSACAPKAVPLPVAGPPHFPEFIKPAVPNQSTASPLAEQNERAWLFLQAGDFTFCLEPLASHNEIRGRI